MKKHLILFMVAGLFTFSACSDDDDNGDTQDPIVGTWAVVSIQPPAININDCEETSTITFNSNNTGSAIFYSAEAGCAPLTAAGAWQNEGDDTYSINVPVLGDVSGSVDFNGPNEFFFVTENGVTITFEKQ